MDFVNDREIQYGHLSDVLPDSIIDSLSAKVGFYMDNLRVAKIFTQLTEADSLSITRSGDTILAPKFWATMMLYFSPETDNIIERIQDSLNTLPMYVFNAGKNVLFQLAYTPNDQYYASNQSGLCGTTNAGQGVNACSAWDLNSGDPRFSVGVYDTGIKWDHPDFMLNGVSKATKGFDFFNNSQIASANNDLSSHGTNMAGVIGAISNNSIGVAGVAGGNAQQNNPGPYLYNMRIQDQSTAGIQMQTLYNALVMGSYNTPNQTIGYGLWVNNMSFSLAIPSVPDLRMLTDAIRWDYRNGTVNVAASGNTPGFAVNYPASLQLQKNMILDVAGSGLVGGGNASFSYNNFVDVTAPSIDDQIYTTDISSINGSDYEKYGGTSFSAAFVSGAAVLLQSAINPHSTCNRHDDIENLLKIYAKQDGGGMYGNGLIDIGNAMDHVRYPAYKLQREYSIADAFDIASVTANQTIVLGDNYERTPQNVMLPKATYKGNIYKVKTKIYYALSDPTNEHIINFWPDNSLSDFRPELTTGGTLIPEVDIKLSNVTSTSADVEGYVYEITGDANGNPIPQGYVWIPMDINVKTGKFVITLHTYNNTLNAISTLSDENNGLSLFPNPSNNTTTLEFNSIEQTSADVSISDMQGRAIYTAHENFNAGQNRINLNLHNYSPGIYMVTIHNNELNITRKMIIN